MTHQRKGTEPLLTIMRVESLKIRKESGPESCQRNTKFYGIGFKVIVLKCVKRGFLTSEIM